MTTEETNSDASQWLREIHRGQEIISMVVDHLSFLAKAFGTTGNDKMSNTMYDLANDLDFAQKMIDSGIGLELGHTMNAAQETTTALVNAVLMGAIRPICRRAEGEP